jgi:imidazolonepropionase-like amidohydrolase
MTPIDALRSATLNAFKVFGIDHIVGTVEKGKKADLIAFKNNPLDNLSLLKDVHLVIKNGSIVKNQFAIINSNSN